MRKWALLAGTAVLGIAVSAWAVTYTPNLGLPEPTVGDDTNAWGGLLNAATTLTDTALGGTASINMAGNANVTATSTQAQNLILALTGTLTGNVSLFLPNAGRFFIIYNGTSGPYTVTVATTAMSSTGTSVQQGQSQLVYASGGNVAAGSSSSVPVGAGMEFWGTTPPNGWILAYGQSLGQATCSPLYGAIGQTYGTGTGGSAFNAPDMRGRVAIDLDNEGGAAANRVTAAVSGITGTTLGATGGNQLAQADPISASLGGSISASTSSSAISTVNDPGHSHSMPPSGSGSGASANLEDSLNPGMNPRQTATAFTGITVSTSVSSSTTISNSLSVSATSGLTGASQNVQPGIVSHYIIYAGGACS